MICLGIDPDTYNTGLAIVEDSRVLWVGTCSVADDRRAVERRILEMCRLVWEALEFIPHDLVRGHPTKDAVQRLAVEGQRKYPNDKVRPNDLIHLAQVAGMAAAHAQDVFPFAELLIPDPQKWKGTVPKNVHQERILGRVGLTKTLAGVPAAEGMTQTQKGHVIDAIGLALWAGRQRARKAS